MKPDIIIDTILQRIKPFLKAFQCPQCSSAYSRRTRLNEHMVKVHGDESQGEHRFLCPFNCSSKHRTTLELLQHCERAQRKPWYCHVVYTSLRHNVNISGVQYLDFNSFTEFRQWKEHEEERTNTTYVRENSAYHPVEADGKCTTTH